MGPLFIFLCLLGEPPGAELLFFREDPIIVPEDTKLLQVTRVEVSPTGMIGMSLEDKRIFVYQSSELFEFVVPSPDEQGSMADQFQLKSFCWDLSGTARFALIFDLNGQKIVFWGALDGQPLRQSKTDLPHASSFNYYKDKLYFINHERGGIDWIDSNNRNGSTPLGTKCYNMRIIPASGEPIFTIRDSRNNRGIYSGIDVEMVWDNPEIDELYPHVSNDGRSLGYIEADKKSGKYHLCYKAFGADGPVQRSSFSFVIDENATLLEYARMCFLDEKLYFFTRQVDHTSGATPPGLYVFADHGEKLMSYREIIDFLSNQTFNGRNLCYKNLGTIKNLDISTITTVIPYKDKDALRFAVLATSRFKFVPNNENLYSTLKELPASSVLLLVDQLKEGGP